MSSYIASKFQYKSERVNPEAANKGERDTKQDPSETYGAIHLLRLFVRLPALLQQEKQRQEANTLREWSIDANQADSGSDKGSAVI